MSILTSNSIYLGGATLWTLFLYRQVAPMLASSRLLSTTAFFASYSAVAYFTLFLVRNRIFVPTQFLPSIIVGKIVDREALIRSFVSEKLPQNNNIAGQQIQARRVIIPSFGGKTLDGFEIINSENNNKWIIWFNANGVIYEQMLEFADIYARALNCNILLFNYCGVGSSSGWPNVASDLTDDGVACVNYILSKGIHQRNIMLHGHSIGGAVAVDVAIRFNDVKIVCDRVFASLTSQSAMMMKGPLGIIIGIFLGSSAFGLLSIVSKVAGENIPRFLQSSSSLMGMGFLGAALGWGLGKYGVMAKIVPIVLKFLNWEMNPAKDWPAERGLLLYHRYDGMIPFSTSMFSVLSTQNLLNLLSLELTYRRDPQTNHMYNLHLDHVNWEIIIDYIRNLQQA